MLRVHDAAPLAGLDFGIEVQPIGDFADFEALGLGKSFFSRAGHAISRIHKKIYHATVPAALRKVLLKVGKKAKKAFIKFAPYIAIVAQVLNIIPGLGVAVGLAIMAGATAIEIGASFAAKAEAKKAAKKAETAADAQERAEMEAQYQEAGKKADEAYAKGAQGYFIPKYGMTQDKWAKLTSKDKLSFLNGAVFDAHPQEAAQIGLTRADFMSMDPEDQVLILAKLGGATDEVLLDEESPLTYVAIGVVSIAIIFVVYVLTSRKKKA